jgi:hypothetical protein
MITDMTVAMKADSNLACATAIHMTNVLRGALCIYFMHIVCASILLLLLLLLKTQPPLPPLQE